MGAERSRPDRRRLGGRSGPGRPGRRAPGPPARSRRPRGSGRPARRRARRTRALSKKRAAARWRALRSLRASVLYATSRISAWTNAYWPRSGERGSASRTRSSRRTSARRRGSRATASDPDTAARPAIVKLWPSTAASWTRVRSSAARPSRRRAISAVSVSGTARVVEVADRAVDVALEAEAALGEQHPDGLDRVQRDPVGAGDDRPRRPCSGRPGDEAGEQLAHRRRGQRLEVERGEVALAGAPVGPLLEQLGPGERDDVDRDVPAPLEEVVDEVEQARVGEVEVLEDQDDRRASRPGARRTSARPRTAARSRRRTRRPAGPAGPARSSAARPDRARARRASPRPSAGSSPRRRSRAGPPGAGPSRRAPRS